MLIRSIDPADNPAVASIIRQVMTEFGAVGPGYSIEDPEVDAMHDAYSGPRARFYVLEHDSQIVGCGGLAQLDGGDADVCEFKKMYFLPEARGQGLGRLLGEMLLQDAARIGFRRAYIETLATMEIANRLYQKLGFERIEHSLGCTGHSGCDTFYAVAIPPIELDPSLMV